MFYHNLDDPSLRKYKLPCGHEVKPPVAGQKTYKCPYCGREFVLVQIIERPRPVEQRRIPQPQRVIIGRR